MGDQAKPRRPPGHTPPWLTLVAGLILSVVGGLLALVFFFATLLTANPCGAFGDACDDYGTVTPGFLVMLALTFLAVGAVILGIVLCVIGIVQIIRSAE